MSRYTNVRKIVVGDDFAHAIKYVKGSKYNLGPSQCEISDILQNDEDPDFVDLFVIDSKNDCAIYWKSVRTSRILEVEYDVSFE